MNALIAFNWYSLLTPLLTSKMGIRPGDCALSNDYVTDTGLRPCTRESTRPRHYLLKLGGLCLFCTPGDALRARVTVGPPTRCTLTGAQARLT